MTQQKQDESSQTQSRKKSISVIGPVLRYTILFNGYCFTCNPFRHKVIACIYSEWIGEKTYPSQRYGMSNKISDPLASYIGHMRCYVCHNISHMNKYGRRSKLLRP